MTQQFFQQQLIAFANFQLFCVVRVIFRAFSEEIKVVFFLDLIHHMEVFIHGVDDLVQHLRVLSSGAALKSPTAYLDQKRKTLELLNSRLVSNQKSTLDKKKQRFVGLTAKLDAMSPLKVLTRGYAMASTEDGSVLRSVRQVKPGDSVNVSLGDGSLQACVTDVKEKM